MKGFLGELFTDKPKEEGIPVSSLEIKMTVTPTATGTIGPSGTVDQRATQVLMEKLKRAKVRGYEDFLVSMKDFEEDVPDKAARVRIVMKAVARALLLKPSDILASVKERQQLLAGAVDHVAKSITNHRQTTLVELQTKKQALETRRAELASLMAIVDKDAAEVASQMAATDRDLEAKERDIRTAGAALAEQLTTDAALIAAAQ